MSFNPTSVGDTNSPPKGVRKRSYSTQPQIPPRVPITHRRSASAGTRGQQRTYSNVKPRIRSVSRMSHISETYEVENPQTGQRTWVQQDRKEIQHFTTESIFMDSPYRNYNVSEMNTTTISIVQNVNRHDPSGHDRAYQIMTLDGQAKSLLKEVYVNQTSIIA
jgi:cytochrome b involved in lipid metabolism